MALGSMSYTDVRACATKLGTAASNMDALIVQLRSEMNSLEEVLISQGASQLSATYDSLDTKLNSFPEKVRAFKGFLETAVSQYEADDNALSREV